MASDDGPEDTVRGQGLGSDDDPEYQVESRSGPLKTTIGRAWREI